MAKRIIIAVVAVVLVLSIILLLVKGCQVIETVTPGDDENTSSTTIAQVSSKEEASSKVTSQSSSKPASSKPASSRPASSRPANQASTDSADTSSSSSVFIPTLMQRSLYPDGWVSGYAVVSRYNSDTSGDEDDIFPGHSPYDGYTLYGEKADTLFKALADAVWLGGNSTNLVRESLSDETNTTPITLWGYGAYLEATGAAAAFGKELVDNNSPDLASYSTDLYKSQYEKALQNVMIYQSSERVNTARGQAAGTYLALTCWPGGSEAEIFYDDDIWIAKEFMQAYHVLGQQEYLTKADKIIKYICETAWDDSWLGGGLLWMDPLYRGSGSENPQKNTCINAPTADACMEMHDIVGGTYFKDEATKIYDWALQNLYDSKTGMMYDKWVYNSLGDYTLDRMNLPYNVGMMIGASARLADGYSVDNPELAATYLEHAVDFSEAAYNAYLPMARYSGDSWGNGWRASQHPWFNSYLVEGYLTLYNTNNEAGEKYVAGIRNSLAITCQYKNYAGGAAWYNSNWSSAAAPGEADITVMGQSATARVLFMLAKNVEDYPDFEYVYPPVEDEASQ